MQQKSNKEFGELSRQRKLYNIREILNDKNEDLDYLFDKSLKHLENFQVIEAERQMALEHLRILTAQLQTRRLRNKIKSSCKYFTL